MAIFIKEKYAIVPIEWIEGQNVEIQGETLIKVSGGDVWNAGAQSQQVTNGKSFVIEFIPESTDTRIAFGLDEGRDSIEYNNKSIDYTWEINPDGQNEINVRETNEYRGTYVAGDIFQVMFLDEIIYFLQNDVVMHTFPSANDFPYFADCSIYLQGKSFKPTLYIEADPQNFEQIGLLNIGLTENVGKIYTAKGYEYNQGSLNFLDYYFFTDQIYTANGYEYETTDQNNFALIETAAQDYTANGYNFIGANEEAIILNFAAAQEYTPQGYNLHKIHKKNINVAYLGAQAFTAEGYDVATMAQENILLVSSAAQVYTPIGYNFEALASEEIINFMDIATQDFRAHFEQSTQEIINLAIEAAQTFAAHFEQTTLLNFELNIGAEQDYTAIGYSNETTATEIIAIDTETSQIFARHYERLEPVR